jgi:serine/threonine protein kinase
VEDHEYPASQLSHHSVNYLPPEVLDGGEYSAAADVWGLGVILFQMASGRLPFSGVDPKRIEKEVSQGK